MIGCHELTEKELKKIIPPEHFPLTNHMQKLKREISSESQIEKQINRDFLPLFKRLVMKKGGCFYDHNGRKTSYGSLWEDFKEETAEWIEEKSRNYEEKLMLFLVFAPKSLKIAYSEEKKKLERKGWAILEREAKNLDKLRFSPYTSDLHRGILYKNEIRQIFRDYFLVENLENTPWREERNKLTDKVIKYIVKHHPQRISWDWLYFVIDVTAIKKYEKKTGKKLLKSNSKILNVLEKAGYELPEQTFYSKKRLINQIENWYDSVLKQENEVRYCFKTEDNNVFKAKILFLMPMDLFSGSVSEKLVRIFKNNGYPLSEKTTFAPINNEEWKITDRRNNYFILKQAGEFFVTDGMWEEDCYDADLTATVILE